MRDVYGLVLHGIGTQGSGFAANWLAAARTAIEAANLTFHVPHTVAEVDEVSFEWWVGDRNLTCFVHCYSIELIRAWGHRIDHDMAKADATTAPGIVDAWSWLLDGAQGAGARR
jgi:hypothetical protein